MKIKTHKLGSFVAAAVVLVGVATLFIGSLRSTRASAEDGTGESFVSIYDDGTKTVVKSSEVSVGEILAQAKIAIDEQSDIVEPALDTPVSGRDFYINIYRAHPALVMDGARAVKIMTASTVPRDVAVAAGIELHHEDVVKITTDGNFQASGVHFAYQVVRARLIYFNYYGTLVEARTQAATVGEYLRERAVEIGADDWLSLALDTSVENGMAISLHRNGKSTIVAEEEIPAGEQITYDYDREVGYREVTQAGSPGQKAVTYEIEMQDGAEISRTKISEIIKTEPVPALVTIGKKSRTTTSPSENETIAWGYLRAQGFSREQTAGIMGNLMQEHHFNTSDARGGCGIAQWTRSRRTSLMSRPDWESIYTQLDYLMEELNTGYSAVKNAILNAGTVEDAVVIFQDKFERCGVCRESTRIGYAYEILGRHEE